MTIETEDEKQDDDVSLRDSIVAAFDDDGDEPAKGGAPAKPDKEADKSAPADLVKAADDKGDKGDKPDPESDKKPAEGDKKAITFRDPPSRWTKEMKETWSKAFGDLDPNDEKHKRIGQLRDMLHERWAESEKYVTQRTQELSDKLKTWDGVDKLLQPHMPAIQASGITVEKALGDLLQMNTFATQRPLDFVKWFADMRKIPKEQIAQALGIQVAAAAPGGDDDPEDPLGIIPKAYKDAFKAMPALISKIQQLEQGIGHTSQTLQTFQTTQQQAQQHEAVSHVNAWAQEKDSAGNLKRPHYDTVRNDMVFLLESKRAKSLDEAYEQAVWMNPDARRMEAETAEARRIAEAERAARDRTNRAKGAAVSIGGRPSASSGGGVPSRPAGEDIRSAILHAWDGPQD